MCFKRTLIALLLICMHAVSLSQEDEDDNSPPPSPPPLSPSDPGELAKFDASKALTSSESPTRQSGSAGSLAPDLFSGSLRYGISLPIPFIRGFQPPGLNVTYNLRSQASVAGFGWSLDLGYIQRVREPQYARAEYQHVTPISTGNLVPVGAGAAKFSPEIIGPNNSYSRSGDEWRLRDAQGVLFVFGGNGFVLPVDATGEAVERWLLREIEDPNGNLAKVLYEFDGGTAYLSSVEYGAHRSRMTNSEVSGDVRYDFKYEDRPDKSKIFSNGEFKQVRKRLSTAILTAGGIVTRRFEFRYATSAGTRRSLLERVIEFGANGSSMPPISFSYKPAEARFKDARIMVPANVEAESGLRWTGMASRLHFVDPRGNGIPEFCTVEGGHIVCREFGSNYPAEATRFPNEIGKLDWGNIEAGLIRPVDLNRDGLIDICSLQESGLVCWINSPEGYKAAWRGPKWPISDRISTGSLTFGDINNDGYVDVCRLGGEYFQCVVGSSSGFLLDPKDEVKGPAWPRQRLDPTPPPPGQLPVWDQHWSTPEHYQTIRLVDIDGDHFDDVCARDSDGVVCFISKGTSFDLKNPVRGPKWGASKPQATQKPQQPSEENGDPEPTNWSLPEHYRTIQFADIDGDRLPDLCGRDRDGIVCHLNLLGAFAEKPYLGPRWGGTTPPPPPPESGIAYPGPPTGWALEGRYRSIAFIDINGDTKKDVCGRESDGYKCFLAEEDGFATSMLPGPRLADSWEGDWMNSEYFSTMRFPDSNLDGLLDLCARSNTGIVCWETENGHGDLLAGITDQAGAVATIDYRSANTKAGRVPFPIPVVSSVQLDPGRGPALTRRFSYERGFLHVPTRDFRGFRQVEVRDISESGETLRKVSHVFAQTSAGSQSDHEDLTAAKAPTKGRLLQRTVSDPSSTQYISLDLEYQVADLGAISSVSLKHSRRSECDISGCTVQDHREYAVDPKSGNVLEEFLYADSRRSEDDLTRVFEYVKGEGGELTSAISKVDLYKGIGTRKLLRTTRYGYDEEHDCQVTWVSQVGGPSASNVGRGRITSVWDSGHDGGSSVSLASYDDYGNTTCSFSPGVGELRTEFDSQSGTFAVASTNALGHRTTTRFAGVDGEPSHGNYGLPTETTSPSGYRTIYRYDDLGRPNEVIAGGSSTTIRYEDLGIPTKQVNRVTSSSGATRSTYTDGLGRAWRTTRNTPGGQETAGETKIFDELGRNVRTIAVVRLAFNSLQSSATYDFLDRPLTVTDASGGMSTYCYSRGRYSTISADGVRIDRIIDSQGRVRELVEFEGKATQCRTAEGLRGQATTFHYDAVHGLKGVSNSFRKLEIDWDSFGRRKAVTDSWIGQWAYRYNGDGSLESAEGPDGRKSSFSYDEIGRVTEKTYDDRHGTRKVVHFRYDGHREGIGRLTNVVEDGLETSFVYDMHGRIASRIRTIDDRTYATSSYFDGDGNLIGRVFPDGYSINFVHQRGYLTRVEDDAGMLAEFMDFDFLGRPRSIRHRNQNTQTYTFAGEDKASCAVSGIAVCGLDLLAVQAAQPLFSTRKSIDRNGRVQTALDSMIGNWSYLYDERSRLTKWSGPTTTLSFAYDAHDNIVRKGGSVSFAGGTALLERVGDHPVRHDKRGRVERIAVPGSSGLRRLGYSVDGSPSRITEPDGSQAVLRYDFEGALVQLTASGRRVDLVDGATACAGGRCEHTLFIAGSPAMRISDRGERLAFVSPDTSGSGRLTIDEAGRELERSAFDPYGFRVPLAKKPPGKAKEPLLKRGYLGAIELPKSNYLLLGSRLYDPKLARFLQPDDWNPGIGLLRRANPYSYAYNNPESYSDANGQFPVWAAVAIAGALFGAHEASKSGGNIFEGALRGAIIAVGGYYIGVGAASIGSSLGINAYVSAAIGQGLFTGVQASEHGRFDEGFARGALMGFVAAGVGRGTMELVPRPATETFGGALGRQLGRDLMRGAASSLIVASIYGDDDLAGITARGAMYAASYGAAQSFALLGIARALADGPGTWMGHSFMYRTGALPEGTAAMQLGFATLVSRDNYDGVSGLALHFVVDPKAYGPKTSPLLEHEQGHVWQYNVLGANFAPAYFSSILFSSAMSDSSDSFKAYKSSDFETGQFGPSGMPGSQDAH